MSPLSKKALDGNVETILLAELLEGANYGYGLVKAINDRHVGALALGEGTIYPVLYRMEEKGLVAAEMRQMPSGRERKYYALTPDGHRALEANLKEWSALAEVMKRIELKAPLRVLPATGDV